MVNEVNMDEEWTIPDAPAFRYLYLVTISYDQGFFRFLDPNSNGFFHLTQANFVANSAKFCF